MLLLHNGNIHTLDPSAPRASALLIEHGEIVACGDRDGLRAISHAPLAQHDLSGATVLPGFTDAHIHLQHYGLTLQRIDCQTETLAECLRRVAERAQRARPGQWLEGHGWNQNSWGNWPTAADLDGVAPNHAVYLTAKSLHAAWVNTPALRQAGITANTADPKDGQIQRDSAGRPTGILLESAMDLVHSALPEPSVDEVERAIEAAQATLWQVGITGVHDFDRRLAFLALQRLRARGALRMRVCKNIPVESLEHAFELGLRTGFGDDWLWIGGVKAFMDGALGPRTAAMIKPYIGEPDNRGILSMDAEELFEHGRRAAEVGLSMTVHAIGDRANHEALAAFEQLRGYEEAHGLPRLRHRIEHVQLLHPDDVGRLAQLGVIASMQPLHATSDMHMADRYWGERSAFAYSWRTQLDRGARLAFGSDAPVDSPNPFAGLQAAVSRRRPDGSPSPAGWTPQQRITLDEAVHAYTTGAAHAANAEHRLGRLVRGFAADLIVLEEDPFECDPANMHLLRPSATMIAGEWAWRS